MKVVCYGDSNTYGFDPRSYFGSRYPADARWTDLLAEKTGWQIVNEGENGRSIPRGAIRIPQDTDLLLVMLGSNDLKYVTALSAATGADELVRMLLNANGIYRTSQPIFPNGPKVLLVAPPLIAPEITTLFPDSSLAGGAEESKHFARRYANVAKNRGVHFLDSALYTEPSLKDCVHITAESHARLGEAIAQKIKEIFSENADE